MAKQHKKPCKTCPFTEGCEPGALGGSPVGTFIAQTFLPYKIPCHEFIDYSDENWKENCLHGVPQCVGHAMFRDAVGVADKMPEPLLRVEHDPSTGVFAGVLAFYAHHEGCTIEEAHQRLDIEQELEKEWNRAGKKVWKV